MKKEYKISFEDEAEYEVIIATHLYDDLYALDSSPLFSESASFGDIVRIKPADNGVYRFIDVEKKSEYIRFNWLLPMDLTQSIQLESMKQRILQDGGYWEQTFGGYFVVYLLPNSKFNIENEMRKLTNKL